MFQDQSSIPTTDEALGNSVRLLRGAEMETDLAKQKQLTELADIWLGVSSFVHERQL